MNKHITYVRQKAGMATFDLWGLSTKKGVSSASSTKQHCKAIMSPNKCHLDAFEIPPWYKQLLFSPTFNGTGWSWTLLLYAFRCTVAHSLINSTVSNLNWQKQLKIAFVFGTSVLCGLRVKVNGFHGKKDQLHQELIGHVETNAKRK